jgi:tetratricopeptide (TPR) repeat protein
MNFIKEIILLVTCVLVILFLSLRGISSEKYGRELLLPPSQLKYFTFGYNESIADSLWMRLLQDIDACHSATDPLSKIKTPSSCKDSWSGAMLLSVIELAPKFRIPYFAGATILSIIVGDAANASQVYEKGLKQFPNDWQLSFRAAYHYLYEDKKPERAAELLTLAGQNGAPSWVYALAGHLYSEAGRAVLAKSVLEQALKENPDARGAERIKMRLKEVDEVLAKAKREDQ